MFGGRESLAAAEQPRSFAARLGDRVEIGAELSGIDRGAHVHSRLHAVSHPQLSCALDERFGQLRRDGGRGDDARSRRAPLAGAAERALDDPFHSQIEIRVVHHHHRILAAHLEGHLHASRRDALVEAQPDFVRAREAHGLDPGIVGERIADGPAGSGDDVQHARRKPRLHQRLREQVRADRGQRRRLEDRGAACDQRRRRLPDGNGEGEVPRRDQRHGSDGLAQREAERAAHLRGQGLAVLAETFARVELEDVQASQHLAPRLVEDLAFLAAERFGD